MNGRVATMINRVSNRQGERLDLRKRYHASGRKRITRKIEKDDEVKIIVVQEARRDVLAEIRTRYVELREEARRAREAAREKANAS